MIVKMVTPRTMVRQNPHTDADILGDGDTGFICKVPVSQDAPAWFKLPFSSNIEVIKNRSVSKVAEKSCMDRMVQQRAAGIKGGIKNRCKKTEFVNPDTDSLESRAVVHIGDRPEFMESPVLSNLEFYKDKDLLQKPQRRFEYAGQSHDREQKGKTCYIVLPNGKVVNRSIVSADSPDFFKSPFETNHIHFEADGLRQAGGVQRLRNPAPLDKTVEPKGPGRYDAPPDSGTPEQHKASVVLTPRGHASTRMPEQRDSKDVKARSACDQRGETLAKKLEKYEGKISELRQMQRQLVKEGCQRTSKQSRTPRSTSASGADRHNYSTCGSGRGSKGRSHTQSGRACGASGGKRLAPRDHSKRR
jgi:hypothetical protein